MSPTARETPAYPITTGTATARPHAGRAESGEFVTKKELAARLRVTVRTIENWQRAGYLPFLKISSVVIFYFPEIVEHLNVHFRVCRRGVVRPRS